MANDQIIKPYASVPYIPLNEVELESRHGAQFFSNVKNLSVGFGSRVFRVDRDGMWAGAETFAAAPWKVDWNGNMTASSITISGYIPTGGALTDIGAGNITNTYIGSNSISSAKIQAGAVTATKISVSTLSAITANIGSITAGTITGVLVRTSSTGSRVEIDNDSIIIYEGSDIRVEIYDNLINFNDASEIRVASIYASDAGNLLIDASNQASSNLLLNAGVSASLILSTGGNNYITIGTGSIEMGTYINMNGFDLNMESAEITGVTEITFDKRVASANTDGEILHYDNGTTQEWRTQMDGIDYTFDLSFA